MKTYRHIAISLTNFKFVSLLFIFLVFIFTNYVSAQIPQNQITLITWENNSLIISGTQKISYAESRFKEPDRLIIDLLNCSLISKELEKHFKSELDESILISQPTLGQVRVIFLGSASINRKSYLTNNERTLITRIARINPEETEETIAQNGEATPEEKITPGILKEILLEEDDDETHLTISATKSIKFNTYSLKNPNRFAIDLLNITPPTDPLPRYMATPLVSGIRVGRAASGIEATRIVIDLSKENINSLIDSTLIGNKIKIKFKIDKEKEEKRRKSAIKVLIDPGHGGYDTGASYGGYEEKNLNLILAEKLKKDLEAYGITVFLTREDDSFLSLAERVEITNSIRPNVFISIHNNALKTTRGIRGVETYYWNKQSQKLAYYIHTSILKQIEIPDHFIRRAKFYVIYEVSYPAVLAELGFLSNREDRKLLTSSTTQDLYSKALSEAILKFLDIEPKPEKKKEEAKEKKPEKIEKPTAKQKKRNHI